MAFHPTHLQPVTLPQLRALEPALLSAEVTRLQNSLRHLERSNDELREFAADEDEDEEGKREFLQAVEENEETIASQKERMEMIRLVLEEKTGVESSNPHYDLAPLASREPAATAGGANGRGREAEEEDTMSMAQATRVSSNGGQPTPAENGASGGGEEDEGMYL